MAFVDYYKILGVDKNIPQKDVRAAYRKRAKQFHPDLHPNDPKAKAKFQALNEAYEVISDPEKRAKYDQYGEQWKNVGGFGGGGYDGAAGGGAGGGGDGLALQVGHGLDAALGVGQHLIGDAQQVQRENFGLALDAQSVGAVADLGDVDVAGGHSRDLGGAALELGQLHI